MTKSPPSIISAGDLRRLTPARVALGRSGASVPTDALLNFTLDHARARDAVHTPFDAAAIIDGLTALELQPVAVRSEATDRKTYLRRPDLGRQLDAQSRNALSALNNAPCDLAILIGDGLSSAAVHLHGLELARRLAIKFAGLGMTLGPVVVASGARVALADEMGQLLNARMSVMLIGERPGLSAPDSLGCYVTYGPRPGLTDAERNCVSNIHAAGLSYDEAAFKIGWLVREGLERKISGVSLKDESGNITPLLPA
ncbi:ethanolamine ammonia-lyase subunit EutC [Bradyrhizobium sp. SYSU BS000235]|uniref:ethanolamine ammonia-lyase subunit EutC n=1 Tax=Bradyrhizobium sp. SYSU BS000235 TaxID=3411332 RepID=UPI003C748DFA